MPSLDEIEALLSGDESRSGFLHIIQVRRDDPGAIRLVAVPAFPLPFNPSFVSYIIYDDRGGQIEWRWSINYLLIGLFVALLLISILSIAGGGRAATELPWLIGAMVGYLALKASGIHALNSYVRQLRESVADTQTLT